MKIRVKDNQSLFDISIQECGSIEAAFALAVANNISITNELVAGQVMEVPQPLEPAIANYYRTHRLTPATGITTTTDNPTPQAGIGYWAIEADFVVS